MRRILFATVAVATAAASASALAAPTAARHLNRTYTAATTATTTSGQMQGSGLVIVGGPVHGKVGLQYFKLQPTDRTASVRLADKTGRTVQAVVQQTASNGSVIQIGIFCGASKALPLRPGGGTLIVRPSYGVCGQQASLPTAGEIHVTLR